MPVPNSKQITNMMFSCHMFLNQTNLTYCLKRYSCYYMQTMQTSKHIKNSTKNTIRNLIRTINIFCILQINKSCSQCNCKYQILQCSSFISFYLCMMTLCYCLSRCLQQTCSNQWQRPRILTFYCYWWPYRSLFNIRSQTRMQISPNKREKQHNFRQQEQLKSYHYSFLYCYCMISPLCLSYYITPPKECYLSHCWNYRIYCHYWIMSLPRYQSHSKRENCNRHQKRPWRYINQMIWMNLTSCHK